MRIAFMLFLIFVAALPFSAQSEPTNNLLDEGRLFIEKKQFKNAFDKFNATLNRFKNKEGFSLQIDSLFDISRDLIISDEGVFAEKLTNRILQFIPPTDTLAASAFQILGDIEMKKKNTKTALTFFQKAISIRTEKLTENHPAIGTSFLSKGIAQNIIGLPDSASKNIHLALDIYQKNYGENHPKTAKALAALGVIFAQHDDQDFAIKYLEDAIKILIEHKKEEELFVVEPYFHLGKAYMEKGQYDLGELNLARGLAILQNLKNKGYANQAPFLNNIGKCYALKGDFSVARKYYKAALNLGKDQPSIPQDDVSESYNNIAEVFRAEGQLDSALIFFENALALNQIIYGEEHAKIAQNLSDLGTTFYEIGNYDKAIAKFNNAYDMFVDTFGTQHTVIAQVEEQIGKTNLKKGGLEQALYHFQNALNANVPFQYIESNYLQNPPLDQVLDKKIFLSTLALKSQTLTRLFSDKGKFENIELAYTSFLACDTLIDDLRRSFIDNTDQLVFNRITSKVYEEAIYTCLILKNHAAENQNEYIKKAFYFSEKNKSKVLLHSFTNEKALQFADVPDSLRVKERIWEIKISVAQKNLVYATQAKDSIKIFKAQQRLLEYKKGYNQFVLDLENGNPNYYQLKYDPSVATLEEVQNNLDNDELLIEFMSGENRVFIFSISADDVFIDMKTKPKNYTSFIFNFRKSINNFDYITHPDSIQDAWQTYTTGAIEIYNFLLKPSMNNFPDEVFKNLTIVPDGILGYLPFEILLKASPETEGINYGKLNYLLRDYNISYAFSGTMLLTQIEKDVVNKNIRYGGFAPSYGNGKLSYAGNNEPNFLFSQKENYIDLPASRKGVEYIADLLDGNAFLNHEATEQLFQDTAAQYDILHLAMHGVYDDKDPLNSHLVFTQYEDEKQNNLLTAAELYNLNLGASLVFIGACNSGFGKINKGEGIMSLSRAFAYAGCPSIIMSLWSVPDDETAKITNSFFQKLKKGESKSEALRQAKLEYLNDSNVPPDRLHPIFWAGFVPIGEMSPLYTPDEFSNSWTLLAAISVLALTIFIGRRVWRRFEESENNDPK